MNLLDIIICGFGAIFLGFCLGYIFGNKTSADRWIEYQEYKLWKAKNK
jgi:hypothetical protein